MLPFFAVYVPSLPRAGVALFIQVILFAFMGYAIFVYARQRHHPLHVLVTLAVGGALGWLGGLTYQVVQLTRSAPSCAELWHEFTSWLLIGYIELHWATLSTFFGILASWLSLEIVGPFLMRRNETAGK